jgi:hypothetical protein
MHVLVDVGGVLIQTESYTNIAAVGSRSLAALRALGLVKSQAVPSWY